MLFNFPHSLYHPVTFYVLSMYFIILYLPSLQCKIYKGNIFYILCIVIPSVPKTVPDTGRSSINIWWINTWMNEYPCLFYLWSTIVHEKTLKIIFQTNTFSKLVIYFVIHLVCLWRSSFFIVESTLHNKW